MRATARPTISSRSSCSLTKIQGSHTLKFGTDIRESRESSASYGNSSGSFTFREDYTRGPLDNSDRRPLGQDLASFVLGYPTGGNFQINAFRTQQAKYYAVFLQDDFRPRSNLTFNLGCASKATSAPPSGSTGPSTASIRRARTRSRRRQQRPTPGIPIRRLPASQFKANGGLLFAGQNGNRVYKPKCGYFSPRFGFAWTPGGAGHGPSSAPASACSSPPSARRASTSPASASRRTRPRLGTTGNLRPAVTLADPFPTGIQQPTGAAAGLGTFLGQSITFFNPNPLNPYSIRWNIDIQRQIGKGMVFEIGYTGNHSVHLPIDQNLNYMPAQYLSTSPFRDQAVIDRNSTTLRTRSPACCRGPTSTAARSPTPN